MQMMLQQQQQMMMMMRPLIFMHMIQFAIHVGACGVLLRQLLKKY
jgi:hypothetical protein